jgi:hypothetical protein
MTPGRGAADVDLDQAERAADPRVGPAGPGPRAAVDVEGRVDAVPRGRQHGPVRHAAGEKRFDRIVRRHVRAVCKERENALDDSDVR